MPRKPTSSSVGMPLEDEGVLALLAVEHVIELVRLDRLVPEDVVRVVRLFVEPFAFVGVEDRAAEGDVLGAVAVAAQRHVPAGRARTRTLPLPGSPKMAIALLRCRSRRRRRRAAGRTRSCQSGLMMPFEDRRGSSPAGRRCRNRS